jgi:hypothetical protein
VPDGKINPKPRMFSIIDRKTSQPENDGFKALFTKSKSSFWKLELFHVNLLI